MELSICPLKAEQVPAIAALERQCFSAPWSESALLEEVENPQALFLCALWQGEPVGYVGCVWALDEGSICNVAVDAAYRRRGVAKALLTELARRGKKLGLSQLSLEVRVSNLGAQALYNALGYETLGLRKNFYQQPREDALIMTKLLADIEGEEV